MYGKNRDLEIADIPDKATAKGELNAALTIVQAIEADFSNHPKLQKAREKIEEQLELMVEILGNELDEDVEAYDVSDDDDEDNDDDEETAEDEDEE